jgi:hypothetical protein
MASAADGTARLTEPRGIALPLALFAMVVIGALVAGNFFAGRLEQQSGLNSLFAVQAAEAAEAGVADALSSTAPALVDALVTGGPPADLSRLGLGEGLSAGRQIFRLTGSLFLVRATGVREGPDGTPLATRSAGLLVRLVVPPAGLTAAALVPLAERAWVQLY